MGNMDLIPLAEGQHHGRPHAVQLGVGVGVSQDGFIGGANRGLQQRSRLVSRLSQVSLQIGRNRLDG
jgi:hypothetical protein